jgi:hypothetical protein
MHTVEGDVRGAFVTGHRVVEIVDALMADSQRRTLMA